MDYSKPFKYVLEIANCRSISLAAENLNVAQSALSKYLKKVESELGVELFDRSTNPINLTIAGKYYIDAGRKVMDANLQLQKQIAELHRISETEIKVGISPSRAPYLLPSLIKKFMLVYPQTRIVIVEGTTAMLNDSLVHGDLDLIISIPDEETSGFECEELFDESILLAVPEKLSNHPPLEILKSSKIISSGKGQLMWSLFKIIQKNLNLKDTILECHNLITALAFVRAGIGSTLVPSYMADYGEPPAGVCFLYLPQNMIQNMTRKVCIFYRHEQFLSQAEKGIILCAKEITKNSLNSQKG